MFRLQRALILLAFLYLIVAGLSLGAHAQNCPCTIWGPTVTPGTVDSGDTNSGEFGIKFRSDVNGMVTGIRFYKSANNNGPHIGTLWSSTGTKLASATFTGETNSGWQQVNFSTPISITAGTTYIASYFAPTGHYSYNTGFLTTGVDNAPLHALANGVDGSNAVFAYSSASTFPTSSFNASNYWVDVVFSTTVGPQPVAVTATSPSNGSALVAPTTTVTATFSKAVDPTTISNSTFQLVDASNNVVSATVSYNSSTLTATLQPSTALLTATNYTVIVRGGTTDPVVKDSTGTPMAANFEWSFETANPPGTCPCTIWPSTTTPGTVDSGDPSAGEFGVRFRSDLSGYITGIRYYKSTANTGAHIGNLWSNTGTLLASAPYVGESTSGWQQVDFPTPVPVNAGTTYVASYFTPSGDYSYNAAFFTTNGVDNLPLHALANGVDGSNGVYALGNSSTFPTGTFNSANYWIDVVFSTTLPTQPPTVTSFTPANGTSGVSTATPVTVTFNSSIDPSTITGSTFQLLDASGVPVSASLSYNSSTFTAVLQPTSPLAVSATYTAVVRGGAADPRIKNSSGTALAANTTWSFSTGTSAQPPVILSIAPANGASGVSSTSAVTATFSKAMDPTTITNATFQLFDSSNNAVSASVTYNSSTLTATLQPAFALNPVTTYTAVVRGGTTDPRVKDLTGGALPNTISWIFTTAVAPPPPSTCPCSIWRPTNAPVVTDSNENASIEVGVKFRADADGVITGIRFYKSVANSGTHIGNLWTGNGTLLASVTFVGESASGWQQVNFSSPVPVSANTTYVASYFTTAGHYAFDQNSFTTAGVDNAPLHALANGFDGGNAVYRYGTASTFPNLSYNASNYWVDLVFVLNNSTGAPAVLSTSPVAGSTGASIGASVSATFNEPMDVSTINSSAFQLLDSSNNVVPGTVSYVAPSAQLVFTPTTDLLSQTLYHATLRGTVKDIFGNALGTDLNWTFTTTAAPPNSGPGGPILVVSSAQNPFTRYLGEILLNEGLNEFTVQDIATVTASTLSGYDIVILGDMTLTSSQASMFTSWVNGGGRLIAMHPDKQLAASLGLTATSNTLSNAYLLVNTASAPGAGIFAQTMQFHGAADLYTLNGATVFATLYSDSATSTTFPAVTWVNSGAGQAAAFTYDLARSVVYTRQGNPAWSGQWRDGFIDPAVGSGQIRSDDLFYGAATFDPQPDYVDFNRITVPQADEQQRLLVNLIEQMNLNKKPLPKFWYFPSGFKAVVIMTGDDHNTGGTSGRFDTYLADSPAGCSVADWTCVRSTSYVWPKTPIPNYSTYVSQGFEIANHSDNDPSCTNFSPASLETAITAQLAAMATNYPGLPASKTNRTHCVLWSDYDSEPQILLNHGIRFDTSYYYWPPTWVNGRSGLFTGSGMPMRYADRNGNIIDVYQATTQMPDEDPWDYSPAISTLLDNALGTAGYYGAFTMNMHTDLAQSDGSDAIVFEAQSRNVPIVSSQQMLTWLDGRNSSSFGSLSWTGSVLSFTITAGTGSRNLRAMLPLSSTAGSLTRLTLNGTTVSFTTQTIKGLQYAMFTATAGSYQATYGAGGTFSISGTIIGVAAASTSVVLSGSFNTTVTTDPSGNYLFTGLPNGNYTVTPNKTGFTFTPASKPVTVSGASVSSVNFTSAVSPTYTISGTISGPGGAGAAVSLGGTATGSTVTDASGAYSFTGLYNGSYTVLPGKVGFTFTPSVQNVTVNGANATANFSSAVVTASALTIDAQAFKDAALGTSVTSPTFSTTAGNELLLAFIGADNTGSGANATVSSVTGAGLTWQLVQRTNVQLGTSEIWRTFAPSVLTGVTVTANFSVSAPASTITVVTFNGADYTGTNGSGAIGATGSGNAGAGAPSASLVTTRNNSWVFGVGNDWDNAIARTPGANQTLVHQYLAPVVDTYWVQRQNSTTPLSGTTVSIDDTAPTTDRYNLSIVEILPIAAPAFALSGNISGTGGVSTTVNLSGGRTASTTTDASGNYTFTGLLNGSYTVTPVRALYTFTPSNRSVSVNGSDVTGVNFTSTTVPTFNLSGTISGTGGNGAAVALTGTSTANTTADASGAYTFSGLINGNYTVTPSKTGFVFSPSNQAVTINGVDQTAVNFTSTAVALSSVTLNPAAVIGGTSSTGTVTLTGPAPTGGAVVSLSDNSGSATTPSSVTVAAGATSATFTVTTSAVTATTAVTVTATYSASRTATLTINPPTITSVILNPTSVVGGSSSTGTVRLTGPAPTGGAVVTLSDNSSSAQTPVNVTVAAGATSATFTVTTTPVTTTTAVTITATYNGTVTATLTVNRPAVNSVTFSPTSVVGGSSSTGTVRLSGPAPTGNAVVTLSDNNAAAQTPASVTVLAGATTATFTVTTTAVASTATVTVTATYNATSTGTLTVNAPTLTALSLNPSTVVGGNSSTGTVTINGPAPTGGSSVSLTSSRTSAAQVPASVTIATGATSATFTVTTSNVHGTSSTISGTYRGTTRTATLTVQ